MAPDETSIHSADPMNTSFVPGKTMKGVISADAFPYFMVFNASAKVRFGPSFEEGKPRRSSEYGATYSSAWRGEVRYHVHRVKSDLPGHADIKVASHLLGRHGHPSSKEGPKRCLPDRKQTGGRIAPALRISRSEGIK
jgi:hypothetical protein